MATTKDEWSEFADAPQSSKGDPWGEFKDAPASSRPKAPQSAAGTEYDPREGMGPMDKFLVGAGYATDRAMRGVSGAVRAGAEALGAKFDPDDAKAQREADDAALYQKYHPGGWATAGEIGADVAMSAMPVAKAGGVLARTLAKVPGARVAAPAIGDMAANAGYSALTAPEDRGSAAAWSAGGAGAGRALAKTLSKVSNVRAPYITPDAGELIEKGIPITPGQIYGGLVRHGENVASNIPIVGLPIRHARSRAAEMAGDMSQLSKEAQAKAIERQTLKQPLEHLPTSIGAAGVGLLHPGKAALGLAGTTALYGPQAPLKVLGKTAMAMSDKSPADVLMKMIPDGKMKAWLMSLEPEVRNKAAANVLARMAQQEQERQAAQRR